MAIQWCKRLLVKGLSLLLGLCLAFTGMPGAIASIHTYPDKGQQVMYRSLQTLRDERGQAWQTVFYKRVKDGVVGSLHLRLVGFPGVTELVHPRSLHIINGTGKAWDAPDVFAASNLKPELGSHVGEYDLKPVIDVLGTQRPLWLEIPLAEATTTIPVPPFAVREWQQILDR